MGRTGVSLIFTFYLFASILPSAYSVHDKQNVTKECFKIPDRSPICPQLGGHCLEDSELGQLVKDSCHTTCGTCLVNESNETSVDGNETLDFWMGIVTPCDTFEADLGIQYWLDFLGGEIHVNDGTVRINFVKEEVCPDDSETVDSVCDAYKEAAAKIIIEFGIEVAVVLAECAGEVAGIYADAKVLHFMMPVQSQDFHWHFYRWFPFLDISHGVEEIQETIESAWRDNFEDSQLDALRFGVAYALDDELPYIEQSMQAVLQEVNDIENFDVVFLEGYNETGSDYSLSELTGTFVDPYNSSVFDDILTRMRDENVEVAFFISNGERVSIMNRIRELRIDFKLVVIYREEEKLREYLGSGADYVMSNSQWSSKMNEECDVFESNFRFVEGFEAKHGRPPTQEEAMGATIGVLITLGIERFNSFSSHNLALAMEILHEETIFGRIFFEFGHNIGRSAITYQNQNGVSEVLHPVNWATAAPAFPVPSWDCRDLTHQIDCATEDPVFHQLWGACVKDFPSLARVFNTSGCAESVNVPPFEPVIVDSASKSTNWIKVLVLLLIVAVVTGASVYLWLRRKKKSSAKKSVWIDPDLVHKTFKADGEPVILGEGAFGRIYAANFRGTKVAVKRALPDPGDFLEMAGRTLGTISSILPSMPGVSSATSLVGLLHSSQSAENVSSLAPPFDSLGQGGLRVMPSGTSEWSSVKSGHVNDFNKETSAESSGPGFISPNIANSPTDEIEIEEVEAPTYVREKGSQELVIDIEDEMEVARSNTSGGQLQRLPRLSKDETDTDKESSELKSRKKSRKKDQDRISRKSFKVDFRIASKVRRTSRTMNEFLETKMWQGTVAQLIKEVQTQMRLRHPNILQVLGLFQNTIEGCCVVTEHMEHGSVADLLAIDSGTFLDVHMKVRILSHVASGLVYLHTNGENPVVHGDIRARNIYLDHNFVAKVANTGLTVKRAITGDQASSYWWAPELHPEEHGNTTKGLRMSPDTDIYAFGITMWELFSDGQPPHHRLTPYMEKSAILDAVRLRELRPKISPDTPEEIRDLMRECWHKNPYRRPRAAEVANRLEEMLQQFQIQERQSSLALQQNTDLLYQVLPPKVASALRTGQKVEPETFDPVTLFFSDIVGYTDLSSTLPPHKVMDMLDRMYTQFDLECQKYSLFKVETIGDAYMCVGGLPEPQEDHSVRVAVFSMAVVKAANSTPVDLQDPSQGNINIRVGFHSGAVVGSVVGELNPRYCLFGDTVNTASRMESNSERNEINMSPQAHRSLVDQALEVVTHSRGEIQIKGKGKMECFFLAQTESNFDILLGYLKHEDESKSRRPSQHSNCPRVIQVAEAPRKPSIGLTPHAWMNPHNG